MEGLISERAYNRNRKSAIKQDIAVLIKFFLHLLVVNQASKRRNKLKSFQCIRSRSYM